MKALATLFCLVIIAVAGCKNGDDTIVYSDECNGSTRCGDGCCSASEVGICAEDCRVCGDRLCAPGEETSCTQDCFLCGNDICEDGERGWCISDCHRCTNLDSYWSMVSCDDVQYCWDESPCVECGDGVCDWLEDAAGWCPDCTEIECGDENCNWWEVGVCFEDCWMVCGDMHCDEMENADACPEDCAECGDGFCDPGEEDFCFADCWR